MATYTRPRVQSARSARSAGRKQTEHKCREITISYQKNHLKDQEKAERLMTSIAFLQRECEALQDAQDKATIMAVLMTKEVQRLEELIKLERQRRKENSINNGNI